MNFLWVGRIHERARWVLMNVNLRVIIHVKCAYIHTLLVWQQVVRCDYNQAARLYEAALFRSVRNLLQAAMGSPLCRAFWPIFLQYQIGNRRRPPFTFKQCRINVREWISLKQRSGYSPTNCLETAQD